MDDGDHNSNMLKRKSLPRKPVRRGKPPTSPQKPRRSVSISKLKKRLDTLVSLYVRQINAKNGKVKCYTCGRVMDWKESQCGHFISRSYLATRWNLNNLRVQCVGCNVFGGGKPLDFEERLIEEIGNTAVMKMKKSRHKITILTKDWYEKQIEHYTRLLASLK